MIFLISTLKKNLNLHTATLIKYSALIGLSAVSSLSFANSAAEQDIIAGCKKIPEYTQQGSRFYQNKQYKQALKAFEDQVAWTEFCSNQSELTGKTITSDQIETSYNNVGLTYSKLNQPKWARAWYSIAPKSSKSLTNLKNLPVSNGKRTIAGQYVNYAGQGEWNTIDVRQVKGGKYKIEFNGLRMGLMALIYGPNIGQFTTTMPQSATQANYRDKTCLITLKFSPNAQNVERIDVTQSEAESDCGFGNGVTAQGSYSKVEKR